MSKTWWIYRKFDQFCRISHSNWKLSLTSFNWLGLLLVCHFLSTSNKYGLTKFNSNLTTIKNNWWNCLVLTAHCLPNARPIYTDDVDHRFVNGINFDMAYQFLPIRVYLRQLNWNNPDPIYHRWQMSNDDATETDNTPKGAELPIVHFSHHTCLILLPKDWSFVFILW